MRGNIRVIMSWLFFYNERGNMRINIFLVTGVLGEILVGKDWVFYVRER